MSSSRSARVNCPSAVLRFEQEVSSGNLHKWTGPRGGITTPEFYDH